MKMLKFSEFLKLRCMQEMALGRVMASRGAAGGVEAFGPGAGKLPDGFNPTDTRLVSSEKHREKLKMLLSKLAGTDIHVVFGLPTVGQPGKQSNFEMPYERLRDFFFNGARDDQGNEGFRLPKDDIVFIKPRSFGDPLTPWLLMHTMAHALFDFRPRHIFDKVEDNLSYSRSGPLIASVDPKILYVFFPMGSLRKLLRGQETGKQDKWVFDKDGGVTLNSTEMFREMFVYFLSKGGSIPMPANAVEQVDALKQPHTNTQYYIDLAKEVETYFKDVLSACKGEVLVDDRK